MFPMKEATGATALDSSVDVATFAGARVGPIIYWSQT